MIVKVTLMALLRRPNDLPRKFERDIDEGTTVKEFLKQLGYTIQEIRLLQIFLSENNDTENQRVSLNYVLQENDELFLTIPVGGG
jgi:sulfur carrier protein ThiS